MAKRKRRVFTDEFKADTVRLCLSGDRTIAQISRDLEVGETALRRWMDLAKADVRVESGPKLALTAAERDELSELRKRVKRLEMEREILRKATAFFAKENG
jgi:transposase-like protein